jgi:hypothetical protein
MTREGGRLEEAEVWRRRAVLEDGGGWRRTAGGWKKARMAGASEECDWRKEAEEALQ